MGELLTPTVFDQEESTDQIRETRAMLDPIVSDDEATWLKLGASEETADPLERSAVLQREAHQAGDDVGQGYRFGETVWTLHAEKVFRRPFLSWTLM